MPSAQIGEKRGCFLDELWQNVFEQSHTLEDAQHWADAFGIKPSQRDWHNLVHRQCPALLRVITEPSVATLRPQLLGDGQAGAPQMSALELRPLLGPLLDVGSPTGPEVETLYTPLWDAAAFMSRFAADSLVTYELIGHSRQAWASRHMQEEQSVASYHSNLLDESIASAYKDYQTQLTLVVGGGAQFPYFWQGLTPVTTLSLFGVDETFDCTTVCSWPMLEVIAVEAQLAPQVRAWLEAQVHAHRSDIQIRTIPGDVRAPVYRARWGSPEWDQIRSAISIQRSEVMLLQRQHPPSPLAEIDAATLQHFDDAIRTLRIQLGLDESRSQAA